MIGKLTGRLDYKALDHVMIDVRGVGYIVYCSDRTMATLPAVGEAVQLYTELLVREDLMQLFGFTSLVEKEWHRLLTSVQGVGAKVSLAILSALGPDGVSRAIALGDWATVKAAKGVGPKTAQRIVLDLKDKAPSVMAMGGTVTDALNGPELDGVVEPLEKAPAKPARTSKAKAPSGAAAASAGALSALGNLGYGPSDAAAAVAEAAAANPDAGEAELIRAALRLLAPKG
ncbi:Holliday junction branch migration protein RuvA [Tritonibacter scottomollicae]|uniref:Holliday junction branch migration complex subunit RuvA n=1 Tax=Tritonibacter scottomollicae TaxID=483013 RepID=A0A2T1ANW6_TRISK|nr:Holliday junction branch migration protein RuvA [Tritonibacter scottomollicae]PRZ50301.1 Holliday junction DNA helicase subunit RuvA [Tritonibacter scottomollicae]